MISAAKLNDARQCQLRVANVRDAIGSGLATGIATTITKLVNPALGCAGIATWQNKIAERLPHHYENKPNYLRRCGG